MPGTVSHISSCTVQVIIGVDTHKDQHVAVAIDGRGVRLDEKHVPVATCGYEELERWSRSLGQIHAFGIEGTGSYGAGLARFLTDRSHAVVEVNRPDRSVRYRKGKSDPTDAEMAARSVLAGCRRCHSQVWRGRSRDDSYAQGCQGLGYKGPHPGRQPDEGTGSDSSRRATRNTRRSHYNRPHYTVQELPSWSSGRPQGGGEVHTSIACLPSSSTQ